MAIILSDGREWEQKQLSRAGLCDSCGSTVTRSELAYSSGFGRSALRVHNCCWDGYVASRGGATSLHSTARGDNTIIESTPPVSAPVVDSAKAAGALTAAIAELLATAVNEDRVRELVADAIASRPSRVVQHVVPGVTPQPAGRQHKNFENLVKAALARLPNGGTVPIWLYGPAGSFKSSAALALAAVLGQEVELAPVNGGTMKSDLIGFTAFDRNGEPHYVSAQAFRAYTEGKLLIIDEIDRGNANSLCILNGITSNGHAGFPCGTVERHADFRVIATANTSGQGADRLYAAAGVQDAALLDRFAMIYWDYDGDMEREVAGNDQWVDRVHALRQAAGDLNDRALISPRASLNGAALLAAGLPQDVVEDMVLWAKGIDPDRANKIKAKAGGASS